MPRTFFLSLCNLKVGFKPIKHLEKLSFRQSLRLTFQLTIVENVNKNF